MTQRPQLAGGGLRAVVRDVVAGEADVLPAERRDVLSEFHRRTMVQGCEGFGLVACVPEDDGSDKQIEARCTVGLIELTR